MGIQTELTRITNAKAAIKAAIEGKGVTVPDSTLLDGMASLIESIEVGGGGGSSSTSPNDVNFYDYDGTLIASYSLSEAQSLTALPDGPIHEGLTFQGWNYTLEKVKAFTRPMDVGAMYITDDGKTRLYIRIAAEGRMNVPLYISQTVANGVTIDWGDGSATETLAGTGSVNTTHTYTSIGDYVITLDTVDGCEIGFGDGSGSYSLLGSMNVYCNMLQAIQIGNGVTSIGESAFNSCYSLASITIPDSVTSIGEGAFFNCYSLANVTIPDSVTSIGNSAFIGCSSLASITISDSITSIGEGAFRVCSSLAGITIPDCVTSIGNYMFDSCYSLASITIPDSVTSIGEGAFIGCSSLASITIPDSVTSIGNSAFSYCSSLASITIPDSVTSIGEGAFIGCSGVAKYHLKPTTPPTLSDPYTFDGISADCTIYVPQGCLEAYQNATNWAMYSSYMREEPA